MRHRALCVNAPKRVMWIHNDVSIKRKEELKYRILVHFFKGKYQYFDGFAAVSAGIVGPFARETGHSNASKIQVIPNFINVQEIRRKASAPISFRTDPDKYNLASMGSFAIKKALISF